MAILRLGPSDTIIAAAGSQNNVTPPNFGIATLNRLLIDTSAGPATFTGLIAGVDGQLIWNRVTGGNSLTLSNANGASVAANQFNGSDSLTILSGDSLLIYYDGVTSKWIMGI